MGYQEMYKQKLVTAEEAVKVVKSGQWVDYGSVRTTRLHWTRLLQQEWKLSRI